MLVLRKLYRNLYGMSIISHNTKITTRLSKQNSKVKVTSNDCTKEYLSHTNMGDLPK